MPVIPSAARNLERMQRGFMLSRLCVKHKIAIMLFLILILPEMFMLCLLETQQVETLICYLSAGLAIFIALLIPIANFFSYFIVLKDIREMNGFCQRIRNGKYDLFFDLPNEHEEESEIIKLKRNMNWMLRVISNRSIFLQSRLLESEEMKQEFKDLSLKDSLTHLYNRRAFDKKIKAAVENARLFRSSFFLMLIDVDDFKQINDRFGHQTGDELLIRLGRILMDHTRKDTDFPFRYGGDEFGLIVFHREPAEVIEIAEHIKRRYGKSTGGDTTLSIGIAEFIPGLDGIKQDIENTVKAADEAVYHSKNNGKNKVTVKLG